MAHYPPHATVNYILRTARPRGWQGVFPADAKNLTGVRFEHVQTYLKAMSPWINNSKIDAAYTEKREMQEEKVANKLKPPVQPSFGELLFTDEKGNIVRLIIPVPGYGMGNMERIGAKLVRNEEVQRRAGIDDQIVEFYTAVGNWLKTQYLASD